MAANYYIHYITHEGSRPIEAIPAREGATLSQAIDESRELAYANCLCGSSACWRVLTDLDDGTREIVADGIVALTVTGRKIRNC